MRSLLFGVCTSMNLACSSVYYATIISSGFGINGDAETKPSTVQLRFMTVRVQLRNYFEGFPWALVMDGHLFDSGGVCSMGLCWVCGT